MADLPGNVAKTVPNRAIRLDRAGGLWRVVGAFALTVLFAHVRVPVPGTPVPMTLQLVAVLLVGLLLSPRESLAAMGLYVAAGAAGLGVFAGGSAGLALSGVTGGYLLGFVAAAPLVAVLRGASGRLGRMVGAGLAGVIVVLGCGVLWQVTVFPRLGLMQSVAIGVVPFAGKALLELAAAVAAVRCIRSIGSGWMSKSEDA